jgi:CheY-like chemotaxis protein
MMGIIRAFGALFLNNHSSLPEKSESPISTDQQYRCTILAIDDDPSFLETLRPALRDGGFNVLTSTSGSKGLEMLRFAGRECRVVLLDYNMPNFDGCETLQHLRRLNPHVKVLALTGIDQNLLPASFQEGVDKFFPKPFRTRDLVDAINTLAGLESLPETPGNN